MYVFFPRERVIKIYVLINIQDFVFLVVFGDW